MNKEKDCFREAARHEVIACFYGKISISPARQFCCRAGTLDRRQAGKALAHLSELRYTILRLGDIAQWESVRFASERPWVQIPLSPVYASVAQWIEHRIPVPGARVRLLSDAFLRSLRDMHEVCCGIRVSVQRRSATYEPTIASTRRQLFRVLFFYVGCRSL